MKRRNLGRLLLVVAALAVLWAGYEVFKRQRGYARASELAQFHLWERARAELAGYLQLHPGDEQARLMMASLWTNDDALPGAESVPHAVAHLRRISDDSPLGAQARVQEAKLQFLVLHKPVAAERLLRLAVRLDENDLVAHRLLFVVMQMTGRHQYCEPIFWRIYELSPPAERAVRLRDWYMSQFYPMTANDELDQQMGFAELATAAMPVEVVRYVRFRETEPDEPLARAALARWTLQKGKPAEALDMLLIDDDELEGEPADEFLLATLIESLIDLGQHERAAEYLQQWPAPREGYHYWRLEAVILEEFQREYTAALKAYDAALQAWPGPADWRLLHRKAGCLARARMRDESVETRARADEVEQLMKEDVHQRLRYVLGFLDQPDNLREVAEFYRQLGRQREAEAWISEAALRTAESLE